MKRVVAIDGPASSGKSVIGEALAEALGYTYFDTGALYRALTLVALERGCDVASEERLTRLANRLALEIVAATENDGRQYTVLADGVDITWMIFGERVNANVSTVSAHPSVRTALLAVQRRMAAAGKVVMVGRDIGTVVVPDAAAKIFLTATPEIRAQRRYLQMLSRGTAADWSEVLENVLLRDSIDSGRETAPLRPAEDAVLLDTSEIGVQEVIARALAVARAKLEASDAPG